MIASREAAASYQARRSVLDLRAWSRRGDVRVAGVDVDLLQVAVAVSGDRLRQTFVHRPAARRRPARAAAERVVLLDGVEQRDVEAVGHRCVDPEVPVGEVRAVLGDHARIADPVHRRHVGRPLDEQPGVEHEPVDVDVACAQVVGEGVAAEGAGAGAEDPERRRRTPSHRRRAVGDRVDHRQVGEQAIDRVVVVRVVRVRLADAEVEVVVAQRTEQEPVARGQPVGDERVRLAVGADIVVEQGEQLPRRLGVVGALRAADGDVTPVAVVVTDAAPVEQHPQRTLLPGGAVVARRRRTGRCRRDRTGRRRCDMQTRWRVGRRRRWGTSRRRRCDRRRSRAAAGRSPR